MPLDLQVDEIVTRQQLNAAYGGGIQGGMLTPAGGRFIFLFSDPVPGSQYGYTWDGWEDASEEVFFYTGEGASGDQEFTRRNLALLDSLSVGREVHLFVADDYRSGSRERTHRYMGQFALDQGAPWRREDSPGEHGGIRSVIVFRLKRLAASPPPQTHTESHAPGLAPRSGAEAIGPEASNNPEFTRSALEASVALRRERALEDAFHLYMRQRGGEPGRLKISIEGQATPLYTDTWDGRVRELYEAKGSATRDNVRLAIGQLLDYRRHISPPPSRCTVLLPTDPGEDLTDLIHSAGLDLVYQDRNGFSRRPAPTSSRDAEDEAQHAVRLSSVSFPSRPNEKPAPTQKLASPTHRDLLGHGTSQPTHTFDPTVRGR